MTWVRKREKRNTTLTSWHTRLSTSLTLHNFSVDEDTSSTDSSCFAFLSIFANCVIHEKSCQHKPWLVSSMSGKSLDTIIRTFLEAHMNLLQIKKPYLWLFFDLWTEYLRNRRLSRHEKWRQIEAKDYFLRAWKERHDPFAHCFHVQTNEPSRPKVLSSNFQ